MTHSPSDMTGPEFGSVSSIAIFNMGFGPFFLLGGKALAGLVDLWLADRLLPFFPTGFPHWFSVLVDKAFVPVLALTVSIPLTRRQQAHNAVLLLAPSAQRARPLRCK